MANSKTMLFTKEEAERNLGRSGSQYIADSYSSSMGQGNSAPSGQLLFTKQEAENLVPGSTSRLPVNPLYSSYQASKQPQFQSYDVNAALKNLQNIASTTTDKQLAKTIKKYTSGGAKKDNFWGQTAASFGSGKINELLNQAWGRYAEDGSSESKAIADAYAQLAEYYQNVNAEALDDKNRKLKWISQDMAQYAPQFLEQTKASAAPILGGAAAGAVIGEMVTPIPGADALIGALAGGFKGAMGGTVAGTKVGGLIGAGKYSYNTMRGAAMKSLLDAGATTEQAQEASRDEAIISTAIENLDNATDLFLLIPGMGGMGKAAAKTALGKFAEWAGNVAQEGGEEFIQELISIANERRVKNGTTGDGALGLAKEVMALGQEIAKDAKNSDDLKQALEAARGGAVIGGFMGPTGAVINKAVTAPMQNAALNAINDAAPNQTVAQQNRNYIAESNADSNARSAVNDYIRSANVLSNEESDARTKAYSEYSMQLDQAKRNDVLVDGDGKLVGQVKGIAGNGFTLQTKGGSEAVFRSEASGSLDKNGAIYKALQSGGEFISEKEYAERQAQAETQVAKAAETAPAAPEMPTPEMATQEQLVQEAPAEMPSETPVSALENEGTSVRDNTSKASAEETRELVGQANEEAADDADYDEDVAFIDNTGKPIYWDMRDQNHDALLGDGNWDDRKGLNSAIRNGFIRIKRGNGIELSFENGRLSAAQRDAIEKLVNDFKGKTFYVDGDIDAGGMMSAYYTKGFEGADIDAKTIINWINKAIQEHEAEIEKYSDAKYQRYFTEGRPDNTDFDEDEGFKPFTPAQVKLMPKDDVVYRLNAWAKRLGLKDMRGLSEAISTILNGNQGEDYAGSSLEKNQGKYAALQRGETVLPEIELIEDLSDDELRELFALMDKADELGLSKEINGGIDITTADKDAVEKDYHGETLYADAIKAIDEDIARQEKTLDRLGKLGYPDDVPAIENAEKRIEKLEAEKARLIDEQAEAEEEREKKSRIPEPEGYEFDTKDNSLGAAAKAFNGEEKRTSAEKSFYGGSIKKNGPSFIEASQMPEEHKATSGGRVRGIKVNGKTYYAVASLEKGGYKNIIPDADLKAANNLIEQIKEYISQHDKAASFYASLGKRGMAIPDRLSDLSKTVTHLKEVLDNIQNNGYTLSKLWQDRMIPQSINQVSGQISDELKGRSIKGIANGIPESTAREQILEMLGEGNGRTENQIEQYSGTWRRDGDRPGEGQDNGTAEGRVSVLGNYGQARRNESGRDTRRRLVQEAKNRIRSLSDAATKLVKSGSVKDTLSTLQLRGATTHLYNEGKKSEFGIAVTNVRSITAAKADKQSSAVNRLLTKAKDYDVEAYLVDALTSISKNIAAPAGGVTIAENGKAKIYATTEEGLLHESNHHDVSKAADYMADNGITDDIEKWLDKQLTSICKKAGVDYSSLKNFAGGKYTSGIAEEVYCELASLMGNEDSVSFFDGNNSNAFTDAADILRNSKEFATLISTIQDYADQQLQSDFAEEAYSSGKGVGKDVAFQKDLSFSDDKEADIDEVVRRLIEEDRKKPSLADYKASRDAMDAESRAETTREIEESFDEHRETNPEARKATQAERFGVKGDDNPLNLAKKVAEQSAKLKEKSVLNNDRKRAKMFGENKAAQRAKARFNGYMDILSKAANAEADIAELFTYANVLKGDAEMGVYMNDKVLDNLRKAADLETLSKQEPTPDNVNAFKYQATKAMAMAAQQAENVDRVQSTIQSGLIEAALKYSKGNTDNVLVKGAQWLNRMQLNPGNFFRMIGGYDKDSRNTGYAMQQRVDRQNAVRITTEARLKDFFSGIKGDKQFRDFANGKTKSDVVMGDHKLSMLQAVQFKMLCDTLGIDDIRTSRLETLNGFALRDAGGNDTFVEMEGNTQAERYAWVSKLYDQAVKSINENSAAKAYMEAAAKMFGDVKPDLVSVGEKVDGFPKAMYAEGKYLPLSYASKDGHPMDWTLTNDMSNGLSATRIMQERVRENGGYAVIRPISQTVDSYISQAANYIAYAELGNDLSIMGDANSLYGSLQNTIAKNFGDTYAQWLTNYTDDINQIKSVDPTGLNKVLAKARTMMQQGALLGSLSVPIKQISSYFSAMGVVDPRAVMKAYSPIRRSGNNIIDYLYKSRLQGSIDPDVSQALNSGWVEKLKKSGKLGAAVVNATNIMDARTVANVYQACCYDVEMNSGLTKAELYKNGKDITDGLTNAGELLVHSLFSEAVLNTQPIFNRQARAEIARTSSEALRMLSVFRTQQTQNYNRLLTTVNEAKAAKKFSGDTKSANREMRQTIGGQVAAAASISALTILADMLLHKHKKYKDDDDEFDEGKILDRFALNFVEAGAGTALFTGDATKWLIDQIKGNTGDYASNKEFYGISMGAISSLKSAMNAWTWLYSDMLKGGKHAASDLRYAVNYTATLLGIPTQNAYNLMNSFYQYAGDMLGKDIISGYGSEKYEDAMKEWDAIRNDFGNKLYSAIRAGNTAKAKESVEQMGDKFLSMIKTSSMEQLKSGDADDDEVLNVLMTYGNRTAEEAADDVMKMHLQIDTGYTSVTGTGKQSAETAYNNGSINRAEFKKLMTQYTSKTADQAEYSINRIDFKKKYPGNTYQDIKQMYMDGKISKSEAVNWRVKTQENTTRESAENWVKNLDFQKLTGYEANYSTKSDLYDTYETKEKLGVISFYDKYGSQFKSPKEFGSIFNYLNNNERTNYPTYKTSYGDASKNQNRVITLLNDLISQGRITYQMAKTIWSEHYGWSTGGKSAWVNVKGK